MKTNNPTKLAKQVERLIEVRKELDRVRYMRTDPDSLPYRVRQVGRMTVVDHRETPRGRWIAIYAVSPEGHLFRMTFAIPERTTITRQITKLKRLVAEERARGNVEWTERQKLDAMARRHVLNGLHRPSWATLTHFNEIGITLRWKKATTTTAKKEQRELKKRLAQIGDQIG